MSAAPGSQSSGDLVADRRYEWARGYAAAGDHEAAADLFGQALELAPAFVPALVGRGDALAALGQPEAAAADFRAALAADPDDIQGAGLKLAALGLRPVPAAPPEAYVRGLFDDYADRFDKALVDGLGYRTPEHLGALLARHRPDARFAAALDLGCGTGLMGDVLRPLADRLEGVDLSSAMVARARAKGRYDALAVAGIQDFLARTPARYDLITAADVFVYCGDLDPIVRAVSERLRPGGVLLFSVEAADDPAAPFVLRDSLRYAHGPDALGETLVRHGLAVEALETAVLRLDRGRPIVGRLVLARGRGAL